MFRRTLVRLGLCAAVAISFAALLGSRAGGEAAESKAEYYKGKVVPLAKVLEKFGAIAFAILSAVLFLFLAPQFHWTLGRSVSGGDYAGAFVLGLMTCFALVASWYPFASDYSRYLPSKSRTADVTAWPAVDGSLLEVSDVPVAVPWPWFWLTVCVKPPELPA